MKKERKKNIKIRCVDSRGGGKLTGENSPVIIASKETTKNPAVWRGQSSLPSFLDMIYLLREKMTQEEV